MNLNKQSLTIYSIGDKVRLVTPRGDIKFFSSSSISISLNDDFLKNFFESGLKSLKFKKNKENTLEIIEIISLQGDSLIINTDNFEKKFNWLIEYLNNNKIELFRKSLTNIFFQNKIDELIIEPSVNGKDCEINTIIDCGKIKLVYSIPYKIKDHKKSYDYDQLEFVKEIINSYFTNNNSEIDSSLDIGSFKYLEKFYIHSSDGLGATICGNELCNSLMTYVYSIKEIIYKNYTKTLKKINFGKSE